jgi:hypothetical protein
MSALVIFRLALLTGAFFPAPRLYGSLLGGGTDEEVGGRLTETVGGVFSASGGLRFKVARLANWILLSTAELNFSASPSLAKLIPTMNLSPGKEWKYCRSFLYVN